jgi:hypothetical protein
MKALTLYALITLIMAYAYAEVTGPELPPVITIDQPTVIVSLGDTTTINGITYKGLE